MRSPLVYLTVLVIATCGLVYELVAGTLASYVLGDSVTLSNGIVETLRALREKGEIGNKVALTYVGDAFGQEMSASGIAGLKEQGFEIVYNASYPLGTQDLAPVIASAKAAVDRITAGAAVGGD